MFASWGVLVQQSSLIQLAFLSDAELCKSIMRNLFFLMSALFLFYWLFLFFFFSLGHQVSLMKVIFLCWNIEPLVVTNVTCGIFQPAVCIIGLVGKHSGLTFPVYWLEPFLSPPAARVGPSNATAGRDLTFHFESGSQRREWGRRHTAAEWLPQHISASRAQLVAHIFPTVRTSCETLSVCLWIPTGIWQKVFYWFPCSVGWNKQKLE